MSSGKQSHESDHGSEQGEAMPEGEESTPRGVPTMAMVRWGLVVMMGLLAAVSLLYYFGAFEHSSSSQAAVQYYCPMHPSVVQDHPGECPICGMSLVPREVESHAAHDSTGGTAGSSAATRSDVPGLAPVELNAERQQLIGMRTAPVVRKALSPELRTIGFVTANESGMAQIQTRFAGWIEELYVSQTGKEVKPGQVLATVYSPEVLAAQQEFLSAIQWSGAGHGTGPGVSADLAKDAGRRLELLGISDQEITELRESGKPLRALKLRSPVGGYITSKNALIGAYVQPGTVLFEVADLSTVWVIAEVYESDMGRVSVGQSAELSLAAYPGENFKGRLQFIYPTVDPTTRTLRVRVEFRNPKQKLRPGMYGDVVMSLPTSDGLVIPNEALVDTGEVQYVFVVSGPGRFEPQRVQVGERSDDEVVIVSGVKEGEVVITTGNFLLDSESRLRSAISGKPRR